MGWLVKLLGATPRRELHGIRLDMRRPFWGLRGKTDFPRLFNALGDLLPEGSILYFEGRFSARTLVDFFRAHEVPEQSHVAIGTLWPRPSCHHVPGTRENLTTLAEVAKVHREPELAIHFHVYRKGEVLLQWHDAFWEPMLLSAVLPEERIRAFAETLGMTVQKGKPAVARSGP